MHLTDVSADDNPPGSDGAPLASALELVLIRHGETAGNAELRFQGHRDVGLNEVGIEQARRLAARLAGESFSRLVTSDLRRARQTAATLGVGHPAHWEVFPALRGQNFGDLEGMTLVDVRARMADVWNEWTRFDEAYVPPNGESRRDVVGRVTAEVARLAKGSPGGRILVVTHGDVLDVIWRVAHSLSLSGMRQSLIPNAGISTVRMRDRYCPTTLEIVTWAETRHLEGMKLQPQYDQSRSIRAEP